MPGQVVDTQTAEEFMREVLDRVSDQGLADIAAACDRKGDAFRALLGDGRAASATRSDLHRVLGMVFATRRRADDLLDAVGAVRLAAAIDDILHGAEGLPARFERFDTVTARFGDHAFDLPGELLHFTYPDRYWSWTRWMWDPRIETGSLRLVTMEEVDLAGAGRGGTYLRVGEAVAFVTETGRAAGFTGHGASPFGVDVFLAAVYGIYMYTVLRMRMTQEFNKVVPELSDLVGRLLGVHGREV